MARVSCSTIPFFGEFKGKTFQKHYRYHFSPPCFKLPLDLSNCLGSFELHQKQPCFKLQAFPSNSTAFSTNRMRHTVCLSEMYWFEIVWIWDMFCSMKHFEKMILEFLFNSRMQTIHVLSWSYQLRCVVLAPSSLLDLKTVFYRSLNTWY